MTLPPVNPGTRKRKAPIDDNGEPVIIGKKKVAGARVTKKKKLEMATATSTSAQRNPLPASASSSAKPGVSRQPSVEDVVDERDHSCSHSPRNPQHILESEDEEDDDLPPPAMDVEDDEDEEEEEEGLEKAEEDAEAELSLLSSLFVCKKAKTSIERLSKDWTSPIYVFFRPTPRIEYKKDRRCHIFECAAANCKGRTGRDVRRFLDTSDAKSTGNLRKHAKVCWGAETVAAADTTKDLPGAREILKKKGGD
jgi:hypothetical protein